MTWRSVALSEVCSIVNGGTPKSAVAGYWNGNLNWITPKEMGKLDSREILSTERKITEEGLRNSSAKLLPINSVILSSRAPIGHLAINKELMATNQGCKGLIPKENLDYEYLYYFLRYSKKLLNDMGSGATFKELSGSKLANVKIPLPSKETQRKLVEKLNKIFLEIDKASSASEANMVEANRFYDSFINKTFSELNKVATNVELEKICKRVTVGFVGTMKEKYVFSGIPFLRSQNIRPYNLNLNDVVFIDNDFNKQIKKSELQAGDVAIVRTGYPGTAAVIPKDLGRANCSDLVIFTPKSELNPYFLELFFNSPYGRQLVLGKLVGAAQKHFNVSSAKKVLFPLVDLNRQNELVKKATFVRKEAENINLISSKKIALLNDLKQAFLKQAFGGELVKE